ncbi:transglutaminase family protein [Poriferisphaera sp. WC338]|uniref:transglutaminase family protein n=1 Tax=Poriferisphaera sp. WC338 TaxID=3425129 RepID=UPI003D813314
MDNEFTKFLFVGLQMGQIRHTKQKPPDLSQTEYVNVPAHIRRKRILNHSLLAVALGTMISLAVLSMQPERIDSENGPKQTNRSQVEKSTSFSLTSHTKLHTSFEIQPKTLNELLSLSKKELDKVDIARMNLLCASELPATQNLDIQYALKTLDEWAKRVAIETDRHLYRVSDPLFAQHYGNSEAQYRAEMLAQVLYEDLNIKYNPKAISSFSFTDPSVAFIHGMIPVSGNTTANTPGGTCVSIPILYVAVGRRLGYPLKLVTTESHIFVRWDSENTDWYVNSRFRELKQERFNIETTNGFNRYNDDYYRIWPKKLTTKEIEANGYLKSLDSAEEFAQFMAARGHHAMDVGQYAFAARCYENAFRYDNHRPCFSTWFVNTAQLCSYKSETPALQQIMLTSAMPQKKTKPHMPIGPNGQKMPNPGKALIQQINTSSLYDNKRTLILQNKAFRVQPHRQPNPTHLNQQLQLPR